MIARKRLVRRDAWARCHTPRPIHGNPLRAAVPRYKTAGPRPRLKSRPFSTSLLA